MTTGTCLLMLVLAAASASVPAEVLRGTWRFSNGAEFPGAQGRLDVGSERITLHYDFRSGGNYVAAYYDLDTPQNVQSLRLHLQKPREATITIRVVDHQGQTFQKSVCYDDADRELLVHMRGWASSWGGPQDGVLRLPVHTIGILIERQGLADSLGSISFTPPELVSTAVDNQEQVPISEVRSYLVTDFGADCPLAQSAGSSLHENTWHLDFAAVPRAALHGSVSLFHRPSTVTLRMRASAPGAVLVLHIGAHFQNFRRTVGTLDGTDQELTVTLPPEGWEASGAAHQTLQYPLRITRIEVQRGTCTSDRLDILWRDLTCATTVNSAAATVLTTRLTASATDELRHFTLDCMGWNLLEEPRDCILNVQVRNWEGVLLHEARLPVQIPGGGRRQAIRHAFTLSRTARYIEAECALESPDQQRAKSSATFTATLDESGHTELLPPPDTALRPESPWGMGVYLYRYPHSRAGLADMDRAAALAAAAGVKWTREEFSYGMIEKTPRAYDFEFFDRLVDTAHRHGISVYALLSYWSPFVQPYTAEAIEAYCDYARATVRRYKDRVKHWEIYNEPNIFFWEGPKDLYPVLLARVYAVIKQEDPTARILGISTAGIDRPFIQMVLNAGAPFDDLTIHPYRAQLIERVFRRELEETARSVHPRGVWITEMGWSTQTGGGKSEREQAQLLARAYLTAVGSGVRNMGWYNFRNDGEDPFYNEANFGVLRRDLSPKAAYRALATVCRSLAIRGEARPVWLADGTGEQGLYALQVGGNTALWAPQADVDAVLTMTASAPCVLNLMGEPIALTRLESGASHPQRAADVPPASHDRGDPVVEYVVPLRRGDPVFVLCGGLRGVTLAPSASIPNHPAPLEF